MPMKKSAAARLQTRKRGTSILLLENINTNTTVPFPSMASRNTTHTPQRNVHQSNRSWHGRKGPGNYTIYFKALFKLCVLKEEEERKYSC